MTREMTTERGNDPRIFDLDEGDERLVALESGDILDLVVTEVSEDSPNDKPVKRVTVRFRDADDERSFYVKRLYTFDGEYQSPLVETWEQGDGERSTPLTRVTGVAE